jgi:hypothetical protein
VERGGGSFEGVLMFCSCDFVGGFCFAFGGVLTVL